MATAAEDRRSLGATRDPAEDDRPLVLIVEDDEGVREALRSLLASVGIEALTFASTAALLAAALPDRPGCLVLDVRLPGLSGLDLQSRLTAMGNRMPVIFMTGYGDVPMSVRAMKAGALDFLTKPFNDQDMLDAVAAAIARDEARRREGSAVEEVARLAATLTPRETEVMGAVVQGLLNKQIAYGLGLSEITVKIHRGNVMRKMKAASVADLVRKADVLKASADR
ncbi:response regulator transcription factor [Methylobacterium oryzisoli]|uniref:response regulator transcription factor n=1 Tax=Methylobacterium oryzisoli TaxID=3385502 RepID=UPI003892081F